MAEKVFRGTVQGGLLCSLPSLGHLKRAGSISYGVGYDMTCPVIYFYFFPFFYHPSCNELRVMYMFLPSFCTRNNPVREAKME